MRQIHIFMHTVIKSIEVGYQIFLALYIVTNSVEYINLKAEVDSELDCTEKFCLKDIQYWLAGLFLFMWFHIMYINLCSNCRLAARTKAPFCCYVCWDPMNMLICKFKNVDCCQKKLCRDECYGA